MYQPKREHYLGMARMHLAAAEFFRTQGPKHRADMEAAYRLADVAASKAEAMLPKSQRVYATRVRKYESEGMTTSDAQACVDAEDMQS